MEKIKIVGGQKLRGEVYIKGSKNSVLPILAASLLADEGDSIIEDVPQLSDVCNLLLLLEDLGVEVEWLTENSIRLNNKNLNKYKVDLACASDMRASILLLGPLLSRFLKSEIAQPGGCSIGVRPIDLHLKGLEQMGAKFESKYGIVKGHCRKLEGTKIYLDFPSVGATQNIMMAASRAKGITIIENVAEEPEIVDLANFLNKMGAKVIGAGTNVIKVVGVEKLKGCRHRVISDRIEAATYMMAVAATGGDLLVKNAIISHLKPAVAKLKEMGVDIKEDGPDILVKSPGARKLKSVYVKTMPYPGFPTDMQSQIMAVMLCCKGRGYVTETIFENRFQHIDEFRKMGSDIVLAGNTVALNGVKEIYGAKVSSTDLRAGAALIIAGLVASGTTYVGNIHFVDRGYDGIVDNLKKLGANIERVDI